MLSPEDHPGIFYFLVGIVVIVLTAVGLSMMIDKRFKFSTGVGEIKRDIAAASAELSELRASHDLRLATLAEEKSKREPASAGRQETLAKHAALAQRKTELSASRENLRAAISAMELAFSEYRAGYRRRTWTKAVGEEVGNLSIRGGKEYRQVAITKVTDVGLEIRHEHGIARIQAPDLDTQWQERFQWNDEERRVRLKEESASIEGTPVVAGDEASEVSRKKVAVVVAPPKTARVKKVADPEQAEKLKSLRTQYIGWKSKVSRLKNDQAEASSNAGYGGQSSVPGSLETWKSKAARLSRELSRARIELSKAKARLAADSPADPLLRPAPGEEE
ncbi:MAG: hypothetical protein V4689_19170 [Verrucomicrobiota bacterium]